MRTALRRALACAAVLATTTLPTGCSDDVLQPLGPPPEQEAAAPEKTSAVSAASSMAQQNEALARLEIARRIVWIDPEKHTLASNEADHAAGTYQFLLLGPEAPEIRAGSILNGEQVEGFFVEVTQAVRSGNVVTVQTIPFDWKVLEEEKSFNLPISLAPGSGSDGLIRWDDWTITTRGGARTDKGLLDWAGLNLDDMDICDVLALVGEGCPDGLAVSVADWSFDLSGSADLDFDSGVTWRCCKKCLGVCCCWYPRFWIDFKVELNESIDAMLRLTIEAENSWEFEVPLAGLERDFRIGGLEGELGMSLDLGLELGIEDIVFEPWMEMHQSIRAGAEWRLYHGFDTIWDASGSFDAGVDLVDPGAGTVKLSLGPSIEVVLEDVVTVGTSVAGYAQATADILGVDGTPVQDVPDQCWNWHFGFDAGLEAGIEAGMAFLGFYPHGSWDFTIAEVHLGDVWGEGDLDLEAAFAGIDPDHDGFELVLRPHDVPGPVSLPLIQGQHCPTPGEARFEDLIAGEYELEIRGLMWNCAVQGENPRIVCIDPLSGAQDVVDIAAVSVFAVLCDMVKDGGQKGLVTPDVAPQLLTLLQDADLERLGGRHQLAARHLDDAMKIVAEQMGQAVDRDLAMLLRKRMLEVKDHYLGCGPWNQSPTVQG